MTSIAAILALTLPALADGGTHRLIDARLDEREVRLISISDRAITYEDARGLLRSEPITEFLALLPAGSMAAPTPSMGSLTLADGRRFIGTLADPGPASPDAIGWSHPSLGAIVVPLERIRSLRFIPGAPALASPAHAGDDRITLVNGDILTGFVESIDAADPGAISLDLAGTRRDIRLDRIASIDFPALRTSAHGATLWLHDGSIVGAREFILSRTGEMQILLDDPGRSAPADASLALPPGASPTAILIPAADLAAIAFNEGELIALASLTPASQAPVEPRRWTDPASCGAEGLLGACDLTIPGPMRIRWSLPDGAIRACARATLPPAMWMWGDCELIVSEHNAAGERELFRERLWSGRPSARFNIPLSRTPGRELEVRIEPGNFGPIQDRIILERAFLLMERPAR